ncbi:hypothetical protein L218DRAFT_942570 [Marasmius fiardii PR-910]|nr:hypothetical protein L218DRAFT_942570 [Marasmius fiardii PR-910]
MTDCGCWEDVNLKLDDPGTTVLSDADNLTFFEFLKFANLQSIPPLPVELIIRIFRDVLETGSSTSLVPCRLSRDHPAREDVFISLLDAPETDISHVNEKSSTLQRYTLPVLRKLKLTIYSDYWDLLGLVRTTDLPSLERLAIANDFHCLFNTSLNELKLYCDDKPLASGASYPVRTSVIFYETSGNPVSLLRLSHVQKITRMNTIYLNSGEWRPEHSEIRIEICRVRCRRPTLRESKASASPSRDLSDPVQGYFHLVIESSKCRISANSTWDPSENRPELEGVKKSRRSLFVHTAPGMMYRYVYKVSMQSSLVESAYNRQPLATVKGSLDRSLPPSTGRVKIGQS